MKENETKREAQLLGMLARDPSKAPPGVVKDDKYPVRGEPTRALGYTLSETVSTTRIGGGPSTGSQNARSPR